MTKKSLLMLAVVILILMVGFLYLNRDTILKKQTGDSDSSKDQNSSVVKDGFTLESEYTSANMWKYTITGQLPNPCYNAKVDVIVAESFPEQVTVSVKITEPEPDMVCTQVIQDYQYEGTFSASEKAEIDLVIVR